MRLKRAADIRTLAVTGFPNHLILYEIKGAEIIVLAVLHGAQRYTRLLRERMGE